MKVYVTSIGEKTTDLCVWSLERNGFNVELIEDDRPLFDKLVQIYDEADTDFMRIDADVIVNRKLTPEFLKNFCDALLQIWWWQFQVFDWYKQDIGHSMSYIKMEAIPFLKTNIGQFKDSLRPETQVSRIDELHNPRRMMTYEDEIFGLHGYGIDDLEKVKELKIARKQFEQYDFELAERLNSL